MSYTASRRARILLPFLLAAGMLFGALALSSSARAETVFGGLGSIGGSLKEGNTPAHGAIDGGARKSIATDSAGNLYIADEDEFEGKHIGRVQKFSPKGVFLAENQETFGEPGKGGPMHIDGLAVDSGSHRVYLLVVQERQEEEEEPVFDAQAEAAAIVWSFSTEVNKEKLEAAHQLVKTETLQPLSEVAKVPLLHPSGIAVNPLTHEIVIAGQQDESASKEESSLRTAVQLIHEDGTLGPRYVDTADCLDEGTKIEAEPACETRLNASENLPRSPVVTSGGKILLEEEEASLEIWEMPATEPVGTGFKTVTVTPHRVFTLDDPTNTLQRLINAVDAGVEEVPGTMSFASTGTGTGRIYVDVELFEHTTTGVLVLEYAEHEGKAAISELGWTAGLNRVSGKEKCFIPQNSSFGLPFLVAGVAGEHGPGENVLVLDAGEKSGENPAFATLLEFGVSTKAEACGNPALSSPIVKYKEAAEATEVPVGEEATISSTLEGANAKKTKWVLEYTTSKGEKGTETVESGYQYDSPSLVHAFAHIGKYKIHETVETDDLGAVTRTAESTKELTVTAGLPTVTFAKLAPFFAGETESIEATIVDRNEAKPNLTLTWTFNDGSAPVKETVVGTEETVKHKLTHTFGTCAPCTVILRVVDGIAAEGSKKLEISELVHEVTGGGGGGGGGTTTTTTTTPPPTTTTGGGEVLNLHVVHNPKATVAGSTSITVAKNGSFTLKVTCPPEQAEGCTGTVTLKTLKAVSAGRGKKSILTLASGSFTVGGGKVQTITLHLSSKAKTLLAKEHSLKALATLVAHDAKSSVTNKQQLTLKAAKKH